MSRGGGLDMVAALTDMKIEIEICVSLLCIDSQIDHRSTDR